MTRNTTLLLAGRLASAATTVLVLALVSRLRGGEALGVVAIGFAVGAIAAALSDAGTATLLVREAARVPSDAGRLLGAGLVVRLVTVPLVAVGAAIALAIVLPVGWSVGLLVTLGLVAQQSAELTRAVFNAQQRMTVSAAHMIVENTAWLVAVAIGLGAGASLELTFAVALGVLVVSVAAGLLLDRALAGVGVSRPGASWLRVYLWKARPFAAFSAIGITYSRVDTLLVGALVVGPSIAAAGAYFAAARIVAVFEYLPDALSRAVYPDLSKRFADEPARVGQTLAQASRALVWLGVPVPFLMVIVGESMMVSLFGSDLSGSGALVAALSLAVPIRYLGYLYGMTLTSTDAQGRRVLAASTALAVIVVLDLLLIPAFGVGGAVVGSIAAAACVLVIYAREVRRRLGRLGIGSAVAWALAASTLSLIVGLPISLAIGGTGGAIVGGAVFVGVYVIVSSIGVRRTRAASHAEDAGSSGDSS